MSVGVVAGVAQAVSFNPFHPHSSFCLDKPVTDNPKKTQTESSIGTC